MSGPAVPAWVWMHARHGLVGRERTGTPGVGPALACSGCDPGAAGVRLHPWDGIHDPAR